MSRRAATFTLLALALLSAVSVWLAAHQKFDYDFEKYFPKGDPELEFYLNYRDRFGSDNDFLLIAIRNQKGAFRPGFLDRVDSLAMRLGRLPHMTRVISPTRMQKALIGPMGADSLPLISRASAQATAADSSAILQSQEYKGSFFGHSGQSLLIYAETEAQMSKERADSLLVLIEALVENGGFDEAHIAGKIRVYREYISRMLTDFFTFIGMSVVMIVLFLVFTFRSFWGVWVPVLTVIFAVIWILAAMKLAGQEIDLIMTMLPTFTFVVGMSDVVHITTEYLEQLKSGKEKKAAIRKAYQEVGLATFLTCITTAAGFFTLVTSNIGPIRSFGLYTALGVVLAYLLAFTFLPAILSVLPAPDVNRRLLGFDASPALRKLFFKVARNPVPVLVGFGIVLAVAGYGVSRVHINRTFLEDLPADEGVQQDVAFLEREFSGLKPFEMQIDVVDTSLTVWSPRVIREMEKVESFITPKLKLGSLLSPVALIKAGNKAMNGGNVTAFKLPEADAEIRRIAKWLRTGGRDRELRHLVSEDRRQARFTAKYGDIGSYASQQIVKELREFCRTQTDTTLIRCTVTGGAYLVDVNNESVSRDLAGNMFIEFSVVALIVGLMFFSLRMVIISIIPNVVPLVLVGGVMGFMGIDLKVTTSMIFAIVFGIAVDDTLHILARLRLELRKGRQPLFALARAYVGTGRAVIVTSIILCGGFISPMLSDFASIFYTGFLVSLALFLAVITDLLLLPVLLLAYFGAKKRKEERKQKRLRAASLPQ